MSLTICSISLATVILSVCSDFKTCVFSLSNVTFILSIFAFIVSACKSLIVFITYFLISSQRVTLILFCLTDNFSETSLSIIVFISIVECANLTNKGI